MPSLRFHRNQVLELESRGAPWSEMIDLVKRAAPWGFLIYWINDVDRLVRLAGDSSSAVAYLMGNHIIMERMFRFEPSVVMYAPLHVAIWSRSDGQAFFTIDKPSDQFGSFADPRVTAVGYELDAKLAALLRHLGLRVPDTLGEVACRAFEDIECPFRNFPHRSARCQLGGTDWMIRQHRSGDRGVNTEEVSDGSNDSSSHGSSQAGSGPTIDLRHRPVLLRRAGEYGSCRRGSSSRWLLLSIPHMTSTPTKNFSYSKFVSEVDAGDVHTASVNPNGAITGVLKGGDKYTSQIPTAITDTRLAPLLKAHDVDVTGVGQGSALLDDLLSFLPFLLLVAYFIWVGRRNTRQLAGGIMGIGSSKAKVYDEDRPTTRFSDIAGYEGAKREVAEVVDFLRHPERYAHAGAIGPRGVLMVGPPGTGKTLLARAVAGEAEVPFLALTGSSFVELFVGVGASRVRDLFADARKRAPSIIFIDEIDAIGQRRGGSIISNDEREQTLNQLLAEMDGFDPTSGVVVMAATNRPEVLDPALLRPGRFDREVEIPLPNQAERAAILKVHATGKHIAPDVDFDDVARGTPGFSGADLANLINEAAIVAVRARPGRHIRPGHR